MGILNDIMNPSFFIILAIVILFVAGIIIYVESKFREQNHKINSMLSLVSSVTDEITHLKMTLHSIVSGNPNIGVNIFGNDSSNDVDNDDSNNNKIIKNFDYTTSAITNEDNDNIKLIEVSDDDEESESDSDSEMPNSETDDDYDEGSDSDSDNDISEENDKSDDINMRNNGIIISNDQVLNVMDVENDIIGHLENVENVEIEDFNVNNISYDIKHDNNIKVLKLNVDNNNDNRDDNKDDNKDDISILANGNREMYESVEHNEHIELSDHNDYKKLGIGKLRQIVVNKGLTVDASKLRKNELLNLLGVE